MADDRTDGLIYGEINDRDVARLFADKEWTYYAATISRLGFSSLSALVEYTHFHPTLGPRTNDDFHFYCISFGIPHMMFAVPREYEARVNEIAVALKLRPVVGIPILIDGATIRRFPGAEEAEKGRPNLYIVESGDRQIYNNDPALNRQISEREREIVDTLMEKGPVLTPQQVAEILWRRQ